MYQFQYGMPKTNFFFNSMTCAKAYRKIREVSDVGRLTEHLCRNWFTNSSREWWNVHYCGRCEIPLGSLFVLKRARYFLNVELWASKKDGQGSSNKIKVKTDYFLTNQVCVCMYVCVYMHELLNQLHFMYYFCNANESFRADSHTHDTGF